jgi:uncharacterized protein YpmS
MINKKILPLLMALLMFLSMGAASAANSTFTTSSIADSAGDVKTSVETNKALQTSVTVNGQDVTPSQFLFLLAQGIQNVNKSSTNPADVTLKGVTVAPSPSESVTSGTLTKTEYLSVANKITTYINSYGRLPNYVTTSLGTMRYENLIYTLSRVLNYYDTNNSLPSSVSVKSWKSIISSSNTTNNTTSNSTVTMSQVGTAAGTVKSYYETNKKLPNYVTIGTQQVTMASFLKLLTTATIQANSGSTLAINLETINAASNPYGQIKTGSMLKTEFLTVAQNILTYIGDNTKAPNYVTTSLGDMSFDNAVYMYSKIMNYYKTNARMPSTVSMTSSSSGNIIYTPGTYTFTDTSNTKTTKLGENSLGYVQKIGPFGTGTDKIALIIGVHSQETPVHVAMMNALKTLASSLNNVQIWVFEVYTYEIESYTKSRSDGQSLANTYVVPNIDTSYKLAIDVHGNRGLYDVYDFIFAPSKGTSSVNYANQIISKTDYLKYYYVADGTSPAYVTIPIANKGIPAVVFELNMMVNNYRVVFYNKCLQVVQGLNTIFA